MVVATVGLPNIGSFEGVEPRIDLSNVGQRDLDVYLSQELFMAVFAQMGSIRKSMPIARVNREVVDRWQRDDLLGFRDRMTAVVEDFREGLQDLAIERVSDPTGNRGSDILLMFLLKKHWKEKYGDIDIPLEEVGKDIMKELQDIRKAGRTAMVEDGTQADVEA